jgi:hypothetical protein
VGTLGRLALVLLCVRRQNFPNCYMPVLPIVRYFAFLRTEGVVGSVHQLRWRRATTPYYEPGRSGVRPGTEEERYSNLVIDEAVNVGIGEQNLVLLLSVHALRPWCNPSDLP